MLQNHCESTGRDYGIKDNGARESFASGAIKEPKNGQGRFDLISVPALMRLAVWYEKGAEKYADRNWEKGIPAHKLFNSAMRHMLKWIFGWRDEDHLAAAVWNLCAIMHFEEVMPEMIDTPIRKEV